MGTMQIPNDPIQQALGPATAALGIENAWIAVAFILLVLLVLFVVLYLRKCRTLRRSLERIDDLEQQVLGLTAMTHLSEGSLSADGDSVVYQSEGVGQQIAYEEFPDDVAPVVKHPEDIEDVTTEEEIEDVVATIHDTIYQRVSTAHLIDEELEGRFVAPSRESTEGVSDAAFEPGDEVAEPVGFDEPVNAPAPTGATAELKPLSADEIRESRESARTAAVQEEDREKRRGRFSRARESRHEKHLVKQERKARRRFARAAAESEMAAQFEREDDTLR
ncbi:MAG: hypothetical protein SOV20_03310 [Coriobacteriales bacterium]|nr:hypothetical protein [Coriobacteriaceae bacterium]MDY2722835.1 hypothetical protein [Coriobacteriales bacterium]